MSTGGGAGPDAAPSTIAEGGSLLATSPDLSGGTFAWIHFELDGGTSGRTADLTFDSVPNKFWHLCALVIPDLGSTIPAAIVTDVSTDPVWVGGRQQVAVSVLNTTDAELKVVITVDSPVEWSSQPIAATLQAGGERTISVPVSAPSVPAVGTLAVSITGSVRVHDVEHRLSVVSVPAGDQVQLTLDAGGDESPVADGFTRLAPHTTSSATAEFGWVGTVPDFRDRARMDDLRRDIIIGRDAEYVLRVAVPACMHRLSVLTGDAY